MIQGIYNYCFMKSIYPALESQCGYSGDTDPRTGHTDPPIGFWLSKLIA